jgi:hypothetical protein
LGLLQSFLAAWRSPLRYRLPVTPAETFAPTVSATREAVFLSAMALPVRVALDLVGLGPITTVTMAIAIGTAMIASQLRLVVVTD